MRWLKIAALALLIAAGAAGAALAAPEHLELDGRSTQVDVWPVVTMLVDPQGALSIEQALDRRAEFEAPDTPRANLGARKEVVWLRVPIDVLMTDDGRWIAEIDYPSLDRIDLHVVSDGIPVRHVVLGDSLTYEARPLNARPHAVALRLEPGLEHELVLRVQTTSAMIVPLRLVKVEQFHVDETRFQMAQGLLTGMALCLALYALAQWSGTRESLFLYYAVTLLALALFFFGYYGLAPQHLWPANAWLTANATVFAVLVGMAAAFMLVERLLDVRADAPRLADTLQALAALSVGAGVLFALGWVSYRHAALAGNVLGPLPVLLAVHLAWRKARTGDEAARYVLAGWSAYAVGVLTMAALLRGLVDSNVWTQHAFQVGSLCEAIAWLRVLGVRAGSIRRQADRADHERELLTTLANTDPLTGLPNRRGLDRALDEALTNLGPGRTVAVFMIDLDGFKQVNDRLGHDAGDELLIAASARLRAALRGGDIVARLGGDEFVVVAKDLSDESVAWRLGQKLLKAFNAPLEVRSTTCAVGLTIGFALAPHDGVRAADLLRRADAAMYAGKREGKGTVLRGGASIGLARA